MMLTFQRLREQNLSRATKWHGGDGIASWSMSEWLTALVGELGEAANIIKKINRERDGIIGNSVEQRETLADDLCNELADTMIYLDLLAARAGIDLEDAVRRKFNETSDKFGFSERL